MWDVGFLGPLNHDGFAILLKDDASVHNFHEPTRLSGIDAKGSSRSLEKGTRFTQQSNQSIGTTLTIPLFTNAQRNLHLCMAKRTSLLDSGHAALAHLSKHTRRRVFNSHGKVNPSTPSVAGPEGLPSTRAQAEGLRVDPEPRSFTLSSKPGPGPAERVKRDSIKNIFSLVRRRIWDFVEKFFLFLPASNKVKVLKNTVMSTGYSNYRFTGTAIALMSGKKGRANGDNSRDHSSHEPFETGCAARSSYLRHTHLPDSVSGYRKRLVKKGIRTPPSRIYQEYLSFHGQVG